MCGFYIIQRICEKVVEKWPWLLEHAFDKLKTQKMCEKAVEKCDSWLLRYVPNDLRFRGVCENEVEEWPWSLQYVPDKLKTQEMCKKAMRNRLATFFFLFLTVLKHKKCVKRLLRQCHRGWNVYQMTLKLKGFVTRRCRKDYAY